ncbi:MAG TPA: UDP-N-acetylmuramate dehydrogenase [Acidimicrobiales bacterium]|nr:UDP-N-acetylmuramate dehydrogenase [Acidimicrobiales bacterium]
MTDAVDGAAAILGARARRDVPIGALTTYRVGGHAALFLDASSEDDLRVARRAVVDTGIPALVIGNGSNMLVADRGFPGLVVRLGDAFAAIEVLPGSRVRAGAAVSLPVLARRTAAASLAGFEWAVGVPGTVGGAVRMNAGGHGSDMRAVLTRYRFVDLAGGDDGDADAARLELAYRHSSLTPTQIVVWAELQLSPGDRAGSEAMISEIVRWRREHQPGGQNAGSVFTNPPGDSAGRLIDAAGLKGFRVGSAHVSTKHANFIQADENGSADDVWALIQEVRHRVATATGVDLVPELRAIGFSAAGAEGEEAAG